MAENVSITVDPSLVKGIIEKEIQAAIAAQLGKAPDLIHNVVKMALSQKVNENGTVTDSSYNNRYDLMDVLCNKAIRETATVAVNEWVQSKRPEICAAIKKQLDKKKSEIVKTFVASIDSSLDAKFGVNCNLSLKETNC